MPAPGLPQPCAGRPRERIHRCDPCLQADLVRACATDCHLGRRAAAVEKSACAHEAPGVRGRFSPRGVRLVRLRSGPAPGRSDSRRHREDVSPPTPTDVPTDVNRTRDSRLRRVFLDIEAQFLYRLTCSYDVTDTGKRWSIEARLSPHLSLCLPWCTLQRVVDEDTASLEEVQS